MTVPTTIDRSHGPAAFRYHSATLALGVGVTITFGVVRAALWRQPPFPDAGRLAMLFLQRNPRGEASTSGTMVLRALQRARAVAGGLRIRGQLFAGSAHALRRG
jgi:hypothetical protein